MVKVAIAGGTSPTLGRALVEAILATSKHEVIILSRQPSTTSRKHGASIVSVDYESPEKLADVLSSHHIHTLISVLKINDPTEMLNYHTYLLTAAARARVSRFILSDWSLAPPSHSQVDLLSHKHDLHLLGQTHMSTAATAATHVVECSTLHPGGFLEYFAQDCPHPELQAGLTDDLMLSYIDIANRHLIVPTTSSGEPAVITMTSLLDVGRFVAAALDLPPGSLTGQIGMAGTNITYTAIIEILNTLNPPIVVKPRTITAKECEVIADEKGRVFEAKMKDGEVDVVALKERMVAQIVGCQCREVKGGGRVNGGAITLNDLCPQVKPIDVADFLTRAWSGARVP